MRISINVKAQSAFRKLGAVVLITATIFFTACNQTSGGGGNTGGGGGGSVVKDVAVLTLSPDKLTIRVMAVTSDDSDIAVEGCNKTTLASDTETTLTATGTKVVLRGKIIKLGCSFNQLTSLDISGCTALQVLYCSVNKLTELNVQGLTSLRELWCYGNQLNAQAMTELLNALPAREASDYAVAELYTEKTSVEEGNCKDYTQPDELKAAFEGAKKRNWKLQKINASGGFEDI